MAGELSVSEEATDTGPKTLGRLPTIGEDLGRYRIVANLAHGGMAAVFIVRLEGAGGFDRLFAMKVLLPHLVGDARFVDMFLDEARIAAHVQHPNVVQVFECGQSSDIPYIVMEYLRGQTLARLLRKGWRTGDEPIDHAMVLSWLAETARGLDAAHRAKDRSGQALEIVHRDVSPQNVLVGYDGQARVLDFGIAAARGRITQTRTGEIKGKMSYLSPEQILAGDVRSASDVWSLGVMAWQTFAGRRLFKAESDAQTMYNILNMEIPALGAFDDQLPANVASCILECLDRQARLRPPASTVAEVFELAAAKLATRTSAARGELLERLFVEDRVREEERIAAALGEPTEPLRSSEGSHDTVAPPVPRESEGRGGRRALLGSAIALTGAAALGLWISSESEAEVGPTTTVTNVVPPEPSTETRIVTVTIEGDVRTVLVSGEPTSDRPLRLEIPTGATERVTLIGPEGHVESFDVAAEPAAQSLSLSVPAPAVMTTATMTPRNNRGSMRGRRNTMRGNEPTKMESGSATLRPSPYGSAE